MKEYVVGTCGLGLAGYVYAASSAFNEKGLGLADNPAYYPRILAFLLALLSVLLLIEAVRKRKKIVFSLPWPQVLNIVKLMGLVTVYVLVLPVAGFLIATLAFAFALLLLFGASRKCAALTAFVLSVVVYFAFSYLLKVPLSKGFLFFL